MPGAPPPTGPINVPIIAMTAHALQRDRDQCRAAGMNGYVSKPVDPEALIETLQQWLPNLGTAGASPRAAAAPKAALPPVFNRAAFLARAMNDRTLLRAVQQAFLHDMPGQVEAMHDLIERSQTRLAGAQAHKIKGAAGNVGGEALSQVAAVMEQAGLEEDEATLRDRLPDLRIQFDLLKQAMEQPGSDRLTTTAQEMDAWPLADGVGS